MLSRSLFRATTSFSHGSCSRRVFSTRNLGPNHDLLQMLSQSEFLEFKLQGKSLTPDVDLERENTCPNRNGYKVRAFARAIEAIGTLEEPVRDVAQVKKVRTIRSDPASLVFTARDSV